MVDILGTGGILPSTLNLLLQIVVLIILLIGFRFGRNKIWNSLRKHGRIMTLMVSLNLIGIVTVMLPSFISSFGAVLTEVFEIGFPLTLLHGLLGGVSATLGITLVFRKFGNVRFWMRITIIMWFITMLLGFSVYYRVFMILRQQGLASVFTIGKDIIEYLL